MVVRQGLDRFLTTLSRTVLRGFFRRVEVDGDATIVRGRPVLVVANHFFGFIDPVVLVHVFGRTPRFMAKSTLWRWTLLRPLLALAGVVPVYRPEDVEAGRSVPPPTGRGGNASMFAAAYDALADRQLVGIFPEGTTHDDPSIRRVRTGAARIALGALEEGVTDLLVVPVGLVFDDKVALRSRVLARVGTPIDVATFAEQDTDADASADVGEERGVVVALTSLIEQRLREVAPDYDHPTRGPVLRRAAEVALRGDPAGDASSLAAQERVARAIADAGEQAVDEVESALARYHLDLDIAGVGDLQVEERHRLTELLRRTVLATLRLALLAPFAAVGLVWNVVPYTLVQLAGRAVARPVARGTVRLSVALLVFPVAWVLVALTDRFDGWLPGLAVFLAAPVLGTIAVTWLEGLVKGYRDWRGWIGLTDRRALLPELERSRTRVVAAVERALAG